MQWATCSITSAEHHVHRLQYSWRPNNYYVCLVRLIPTYAGHLFSSCKVDLTPRFTAIVFHSIGTYVFVQNYVERNLRVLHMLCHTLWHLLWKLHLEHISYCLVFSWAERWVSVLMSRRFSLLPLGIYKMVYRKLEHIYHYILWKVGHFLLKDCMRKFLFDRLALGLFVLRS